MRLFVTGGSGFLGRRIVADALRRGHEVTVLSRRAAPGDPEPRLLWIEGDLTDSASLPRHLAAAEPQAVIHAAAVVSDTDPHLHNVNVTGTAHLVAALRPHDEPPRLVFVSSFAVEDVPPTPYSESKREAEALVATSGLPFVILRPALIYGPGDVHNTPRVVERMRAGTQWLPGGGRAEIQPTFVDDVAAACVAAAVREGVEGRTYRLGGPSPVSVSSYRYAVRDASGGSARIRSIPLPLYAVAARLAALVGLRRPSDVLAFHRCDHAVDSEAARRDLDYAPRPLKQGLEQTFPHR